MATKELEHLMEKNLRGKSHDFWDKQFGLGKYGPTTTTYRAAVIVSNHVFPDDDPYVEKIRVLAEKDRKFCRRLHDDEPFRILFCERGGNMYETDPKSPKEQAIQDSIDKSITERVDLVLTQKVLLGKYFHLLSENEKVKNHKLVNKEIGFMPQFLQTCRVMKNGEKIKRMEIQISSLNYFKMDEHKAKNPTYPTTPYMFDD